VRVPVGPGAPGQRVLALVVQGDCGYNRRPVSVTFSAVFPLRATTVAL
jgi:hypothetical protein